jgi:hypothetical protein
MRKRLDLFLIVKDKSAVSFPPYRVNTKPIQYQYHLKPCQAAPEQTH